MISLITKANLKVSLMATLFCIISTKNFATTYYVNAATGNDANTGTSLVDALLTIQKGLDKATTPGDIILVSAGTYKQNLVWKFSGNTASKITLQKNGVGVVFIKSADASASPVLQITNISNIVIDGFTITRDNAKNNAQGILISSSGAVSMQNIEVKNCVFTGINWSTNPNTKPTASQNAQPLIVYGRSSQAIKNVSVQYCDFNNNITGQSEVCSFNSNIDGFNAANNILHDNTNIAIDVIGFEGENSNVNLDQARNGIISGNTFYVNQSPYAEGAGIYVDGGKSILIENNLVRDGDYGIEISAENDKPTIAFETQDITVRNNLIFNCRSAGLKIGNYKGKLQNALVANNTCFYNNRGGKRDGDVSGTSRNVAPWAELVIDNMQDVKINSNIFYARTSNTAMINSDGNALITNLIMNYNLWNNKNNAAGTGLTFQFKINSVNYNYTSYSAYKTSNTLNFDKQSNYGNPNFVNEGIVDNNSVDPDLHIQTGSIAIAGGDPSAVTGTARGFWGITDYFGNSRIVGVIDMGAHELATGSLQKNAGNAAVHVTVFPNPTANNAFIKGLPEGAYNCSVTDRAGNTLFTSKLISANNTAIDVARLKEGIYNLKIYNKEVQYSCSFIKQ